MNKLLEVLLLAVAQYVLLKIVSTEDHWKTFVLSECQVYELK